MHFDSGRLDDLNLNAFSIPEHKGDGGRMYEPTITVEPFGDPNYRLTMTIDEAAEIAAVLTGLVADARRGEFSEYGERILDFGRRKAYRQAWETLIENSGDDG